MPHMNLVNYLAHQESLVARLLARWESRSPMDSHLLANLDILRYLCTHNH